MNPCNFIHKRQQRNISINILSGSNINYLKIYTWKKKKNKIQQFHIFFSTLPIYLHNILIVFIIKHSVNVEIKEMNIKCNKILTHHKAISMGALSLFFCNEMVPIWVWWEKMALMCYLCPVYSVVLFRLLSLQKTPLHTDRMLEMATGISVLWWRSQGI